MKKQILNLGKALNKADQKEINGGGTRGCHMFFFEYCTTTQGACTDPRYISYCEPCCNLI